MSPHEQAEEFIASYTKLMHEDTDISNFQKVLEMKVRTQLVHSTFLYTYMSRSLSACIWMLEVLSIMRIADWNSSRATHMPDKVHHRPSLTVLSSLTVLLTKLELQLTVSGSTGARQEVQQIRSFDHLGWE